jgi:murein DD-endopeptidase MepM/ murein hydrolase activator NlpD
MDQNAGEPSDEGMQLSRRGALVSAGLAAALLSIVSTLKAQPAAAVGPGIDWPFSPSTLNPWASGGRFGDRSHAGLPYHNGVDFGRPNGTDVYACCDGTAEVVSTTGDLGHYIRLNHGSGLKTGYAHLQSGTMTVSQGQGISRGQYLGKTGTTGFTQGGHLHWETWLNGTRVDPESFMATYGTGAVAPNTGGTMTPAQEALIVGKLDAIISLLMVPEAGYTWSAAINNKVDTIYANQMVGNAGYTWAAAADAKLNEINAKLP